MRPHRIPISLASILYTVALAPGREGESPRLQWAGAVGQLGSLRVRIAMPLVIVEVGGKAGALLRIPALNDRL